MTDTTAFPLPASPPSWALLGAEPLRAAIEYARMRFMNKATLPRGDGHPVLIFPGLASDHRAVAPLKTFCERLGYTAYDWGRGLNAGPKGEINAWLDDLARDIGQIAAAHRDSISLVGWSLGGIYAREVGKRLGRGVRHVITIGSPFAGAPENTNVGALYRFLSGQKPQIDEALRRQLGTPPAVPTTSIYSRSDGVVAWQACVQGGGLGHVENIEVEGSHCGLGWNAAVLAIVADRLQQPEGAWCPYRAQRA